MAAFVPAAGGAVIWCISKTGDGGVFNPQNGPSRIKFLAINPENQFGITAKMIRMSEWDVQVG